MGEAVRDVEGITLVQRPLVVLAEFDLLTLVGTCPIALDALRRYLQVFEPWT